MVDPFKEDLEQTEIEKQEFMTLKRQYMRTFNSEDGKVLEDLRYRCYVDSPISNEIEEGMRRVFLHIQTMISGEGMGAEEKEE